MQTTLGLHTHRDRVEIYVEVEKPYYIDSEGYLHWEVEGEERIKSQKIKVLNTDKKTYKDFDIRKQIIGNLGHTADLKTDDFDERGLIKFKAIVLHRTNEEMALSTLNTYTNKNVAGAHFLIDKDGTIYQTEILKKYTWHVGDIRPKQYDAGISKPNEKSIIDTIWNNKSSSYKVKKIKVSDYEKTKSYPNRYPINSDSIGIEVVGKYKSNQWEVATQAQKDSIKNLVEILKEEYNLNNDDVYEHDDISPQKVRGEAKGLYEKE